MGEECPTPGRSARQATLSLAVQVSGRFFSLEVPSRRGPRQLGQSSARAEQGAAKAATISATIGRKSFFAEGTGFPGTSERAGAAQPIAAGWSEYNRSDGRRQPVPKTEARKR